MYVTFPDTSGSRTSPVFYLLRVNSLNNGFWSTVSPCNLSDSELLLCTDNTIP